MSRSSGRTLLAAISAFAVFTLGCQGSPNQPGPGQTGPGGVPLPGQSGVPLLGPNVSTDASKGDDIYKPHSNVDLQARIAGDAAEILQLARQPELPAADVRSIYENGKNARGTSLQSVARDEDLAAEFPIETAVFGTPRFLDAPLSDAIAGTGTAAAFSSGERRQAITAGVQRLLTYSIFHQLSIAEAKIRKGDPDPADRSHNYIDRAWALYTGTAEGDKNPSSLAATAVDLERAFGRSGAIDRPLREALTKMQDGASRRNLDVFLPARAEVDTRLNQIFYLATARQLTEALRAADRGDNAAAMAQQVQGMTLYMTIQSSVITTDPGADRVITQYFQTTPEQLTVTLRDEALAALNQAAPAFNLKTADTVTARDYQA